MLTSQITHVIYSCKVEFRDVQSEEERDIVIELNLPAVEADEEEGPVLKTSLYYFDITSSTQVEVTQGELRVARTGKGKNVETRNEKLSFIALCNWFAPACQ